MQRDTDPPVVQMRDHSESTHPTIPSRQAVLEAAQQLIQEQGYAGLSMRELARRSGLAKATIYHHFQDKRDVLLSVFENDIRTVAARITEAARTPGSPAERLRAVIAAYFAIQVERRMVILNAIRETVGLEDQIWAIIRSHRHELLRPIMAIIQDAINSGIARPVNVELAVMALFGMIHSFVTHRLLIDGENLTSEMEEFVLEMFLHALQIPPDTSAPVGAHIATPFHTTSPE
jgi:AcrR family transcriptional regulator